MSLTVQQFKSQSGRLSRDVILAAIATTIAWGPLLRKPISRLTAETLPWYPRLCGAMTGASIPAASTEACAKNRATNPLGTGV